MKALSHRVLCGLAVLSAGCATVPGQVGLLEWPAMPSVHSAAIPKAVLASPDSTPMPVLGRVVVGTGGLNQRTVERSWYEYPDAQRYLVVAPAFQTAPGFFRGRLGERAASLSRSASAGLTLGERGIPIGSDAKLQLTLNVGAGLSIRDCREVLLDTLDPQFLTHLTSLPGDAGDRYFVSDILIADISSQASAGGAVSYRPPKSTGADDPGLKALFESHYSGIGLVIGVKFQRLRNASRADLDPKYRDAAAEDPEIAQFLKLEFPTAVLPGTLMAERPSEVPPTVEPKTVRACLLQIVRERLAVRVEPFPDFQIMERAEDLRTPELLSAVDLLRTEEPTLWRALAQEVDSWLERASGGGPSTLALWAGFPLPSLRNRWRPAMWSGLGREFRAYVAALADIAETVARQSGGNRTAVADPFDLTRDSTSSGEPYVRVSFNAPLGGATTHLVECPALWQTERRAQNHIDIPQEHWADAITVNYYSGSASWAYWLSVKVRSQTFIENRSGPHAAIIQPGSKRVRLLVWEPANLRPDSVPK